MFHQIVKELVLPGLQEGLRTNGNYSLTIPACQQGISRAILNPFFPHARIPAMLHFRKQSAAIIRGGWHRNASSTHVTTGRWNESSAISLSAIPIAPRDCTPDWFST